MNKAYIKYQEEQIRSFNQRHSEGSSLKFKHPTSGLVSTVTLKKPAFMGMITKQALVSFEEINGLFSLNTIVE